MPGLDKFSDFQYLTRDIKLTGPEELLNEAVSHNYLIGDMLTGRESDHIFRGGTKITERIQARDNNSFRTYKPNDELNPTAADTVRRINANWRFTVGGYAWNDNEILLNEGDPNRYGDLKYDYEQGAMTSIVNGMEGLLFNQASQTDMEADAGETPYSIPTFITEETTGYTAGLSTIMGLAPSSEPWWDNQRAGYDASDAETADNKTNIFSAFDIVMRKVRFQMINIAQMRKYWEDDNLRKMRIVTNGNGRDIFMRMLRAKNYLLRAVGTDGQDAAYPDPRYDGYPVQWVEKLDTAALFGSTYNSLASSFNANGSMATGYPRFYFLNMKYLFPVFHNQKYFDQVMRDGGARQPFTHVMWIDTYYNLVCRSRRRQGIVYPSQA
jgi:hypothetical protein